MRRRLRLLGISCAAVALSAVPGRSAVEGSPHDLIGQGYDVVKTSASRDRCTRCHLPVGAGESRLPPRGLPPVPPSKWAESSLVCFSCHDGTTIVSPDVDASLTAFHPDAHRTDLLGVAEQAAAETGLPALEGRRTECVACHEPHDAGQRPFLRLPVGDLCTACHSLQAGTGRGKDNVTGNHPIGLNPAEEIRKEAPVVVTPDFRTPFPSPYPMQGGKGSAGIHWDLGGHLAGGGEGTMVCATCHTVHGDENAPPRGDLLTTDPVREVADLFCEGCHAGGRGDGQETAAKPNPGGTTTGRTYHPADDDTANGAGRIVSVREPEGWPFGAGKPGTLLCTTCHSAHAARAGASLVRQPVAAPTFCEECHDLLEVEHHHPTAFETPGQCGVLLAPPAPEEKLRLSCELCHRAHNAGLGAASEAAYVPLLRESLTTDALCSSCHAPENPTCRKEPELRASHFLGDPELPETYEDADPPLWTEPWPESKLSSIFGGEKRRTVLCLSCHSFRKGALVSGDKGKGRFLLARSGNVVEWTEENSGWYLCVGCHGLQPGTKMAEKGHTHPLMNGDALKLGRDPQSPVTVTPNGRVNCDSCHRPHEAKTAGGYYILEAVESQNEEAKEVHPRIDFTTLCRHCHDPASY